jgi:hypothetical protein
VAATGDKGECRPQGISARRWQLSNYPQEQPPEIGSADRETMPSIFWLIDIVQAASSVIYVQPASVGMPEWVRILISAETGAAFVILGNIMMEFATPYISKSVSKRTVTAQLGAELVVNMDSIEGAVRFSPDSQFIQVGIGLGRGGGMSRSKHPMPIP